MMRKTVAAILAAVMALLLPGCAGAGCAGEGQTHVILIGGQSNAVGCSSLFDLKATEDGRYEKAKEGFERIRLACYCDFCTEDESFSQSLVHLEAYNGFGPEIGLGLTLAKTRRRDRFFILKSAWGGTSLAENWLQDGRRGGYYEMTMGFWTRKLAELRAQNVHIDTMTLCWMQGERDGADREMAEAYRANEECLFTYFREDLRPWGPELGIVDAYVSTRTGNPYAGIVNEAKLAVSQTLENVVILETNGEHRRSLCLTFDEGEKSHYDAESMYDLGVGFAKKIVTLF